MTKKDYITIANALKPFYEDWEIYHCDDLNYTTIEIITAISKALSKDNSKFDPIKFLEYLRQ